jgi:acyl dehydratase
MVSVHGIPALRALTGTRLGTSAWHEVTQERIDAFADATEDWEGLHVDPARAARTTWGVTIAHGLYTLSLGPKFQYEVLSMSGYSLPLNYGFDKVRFTSPVLVGSRLRMSMDLLGHEPLDGGSRFRSLQTFEVEGQDKPACVAESVFAYFD